MSNNKWVFCFGSQWKSPSVYTEKHLVNKLFNMGIKILWIDPVPNRKLNVQRSGNKKNYISTIIKRIAYQTKIISKINNGFYLMRPIFHPNVQKYITLNNYLLKTQIRLFIIYFKISELNIISSALVDINAIIEKSKYKKFIQISGDLYSDLRGISNEYKLFLECKEKKIFELADYVIIASKRVFNKIKTKITNQNKLIYLPHGVEYSHFNVKDVHTKIVNIKEKGLPIAGYFGGLTQAVSQDFFLELANSNYSVILIGPISGDFTNLKKQKNIYLLGSVDYNELPKYANGFDVCIMAWHSGEWIKNCNPSKTLEYLALGKPIVSVPIPELQENFSEFIEFAETPMSFVEKCNLALKNNNEEQIQRRKSFAKNNDWNFKIQKIFNLIYE